MGPAGAIFILAGFTAPKAVEYLEYIILEKDGPFGILRHVAWLSAKVPALQQKERFLSAVFVTALLAIGLTYQWALWLVIVLGLSRNANKGEFI